MKKYLLPALALMLSASAWAQEKVLLDVNLSSGATKTFDVSTPASFKGSFGSEGNSLQLTADGVSVGSYNVSDLTSLAVSQGKLALAVTLSDGTTYNYRNVATLLRQSAESIGDATLFGFSTVAATSPADACAGELGLYLSLSPSVLNAGTFDLASIKNSCAVKLVKYLDGGREWLKEELSSGSITTSLNAKNKQQTITLDALYADGTSVKAEYTGVPTDIASGTSMSDMLPDQVYGNELFYYNADGDLTTHSTITAIKTTSKTVSGDAQIRFTFTTNPASSYGTSTFYLQVSKKLFNTGKVYAPEAPDKSWQVCYGEFQMVANEPHSSSMESGYYKNIADNGYFRVDDNGDGTYNIFFDAQFFYNNAANGLTHSGNPSRLIINYKAK